MFKEGVNLTSKSVSMSLKIVVEVADVVVELLR